MKKCLGQHGCQGLSGVNPGFYCNFRYYLVQQSLQPERSINFRTSSSEALVDQLGLPGLVFKFIRSGERINLIVYLGTLKIMCGADVEQM